MSTPSPQKLLSDLIAINSTNPDLIPGAPGEGEIAAFIASWLEQAGLEVHIDEVLPNRPNVTGIARGSGGGKTLLFNGHMDVVSAAGIDKPFQPQVKDGRLYGRGAYDMKGGLAACMLAAAAAKETNLRGDVILSAVIDEEYAGQGTIAASQRYRADGAIIAEPTEMQLIIAHRGFVWLDIEIRGVAAHGSRPDLGIDAIIKTGRLLTALEELDRKLRTHPTHPLLHSGSLHASFIKGGHEIATYPDRCVLTLERRTLPGETPESVEGEIRQIIEQIQRVDPAFKAEVRRGLDRSPLEIPEECELVAVLKSAAARIMGNSPAITGVPYWTDAATLYAAGIPAVLFGPLGAGAHADVEWVDLASVQACTEIFFAAAIDFCR
jgi:acetylornithine deacetylase